MEVITNDNINDQLNVLIYDSFMDFNKFMDSDSVYDLIKEISIETDLDILEDFLDYIYGEKLINYILEFDNILLFNKLMIEKVIKISKELIKNK